MFFKVLQKNTFMPYPVSMLWLKFYIKFGNRLCIFKREEERRARPLLFEYNLLPKLISNFYHYIDKALVTKKSKSKQGFQNLKKYPHQKTMLRMEGCPLLCTVWL